MKYFLILIPAVLITLINPYGIKYWDFILHAATMPRITIAEWMPTPLFGAFSEWRGFKLLLISSFISIVFYLAKYRFRNIDYVKYILIFVTLYLSLKHIKHHPIFAIAAGSFLYHDFYRIFTAIRDFLVLKFGTSIDNLLRNSAAIKNFILYTIIILAGSLFVFNKSLEIKVPDYKYPIEAVEFIKENDLSGNLLAPFHWGSYLAWNLYPQCLIAIDGRYEEVYPEVIDKLTANFDYVVDKNWYDFINKHHTDILLLDKNLDSYSAILKSRFWKKVYDDKISAVFIPVDTARNSYIYPKVNKDKIKEEKYNNSINFLR